MLDCIEQRVRVVAGVRREYERINPKADFGRVIRPRLGARQETVAGVTAGVKPSYLSFIINAVGDGSNGPRGINPPL
jgi:hypothetical protein